LRVLDILLRYADCVASFYLRQVIISEFAICRENYNFHCFLSEPAQA